MAILCLCAFASAAELDPARIDATATELIAIGDRAMGTPGAEQAIALIERQLTEAGLAPMRVRTTVAIAQPVGDDCRLEVGGQSIPLSAHRPARGSTGGTAGVAVSGPLLFAGQGEDADFRGKTVEGTIVVLDGDSDDGWTRAAELGAAAVVFSGTLDMDRRRVHRQSVDISLEFPRFVADLDRALDGQVATLRGDLAWTPAAAWSVIARIAGTGKRSEAVLLATAYESPSTIVGRCPGAIRAWNTAALLELARSFAAEPPNRDLLVVFHGGRGEMVRGLRHLVAGLCLDQTAGVYDPQGQLATLSADLGLRLWRDQRAGEALQRFVASHGESQDALRRLIVDGLGTLPANAGDAETEIQAISARADGFLSLEAGQRADRMQVPLERDRVAASRLPEAERGAARAARAARESEYTRYRTIQGKLSYGKPLIGEEGGLLSDFATTAASNVGRHLAVLSNQRDDLSSLIAARAALSGATPIHLICLDLSDGNDRYSSLSTGPMVNWANDLGWLHSGLAKLVNDLNRDGDVARIAFETAVYDVQDEAAAWFQEEYVAEAGICGLYIPAATLATVCDARLKHASPMDTAAALDAGNLRTQAAGLRRFLAAYVDAAFLDDRKPRGLSSKSPRLEIEVRSLGTKTGRRGYPYPLSFIGTTRDTPDAGDMMMQESHWGDAFGVVRVPFVPEMHNALNQGLPIYSYGFRPDGGIAAALASGGSMKASENLSFVANWTVNDALALLFEGEQSRLYGIFDPRLLVPLAAVSPLSATRDSAPNFTHVETSHEHALSAIWTEPGMRLRVTATQGKIGNRLVLTGGATAQRAKGEQGDPGDPAARAAVAARTGLSPGRLANLTAVDTAEDTWSLNEQRLSLLRSNGISSDGVVSLHSAAERHLELAREALAAKDWGKAQGEGQAAWSLSGRVYPSVLSTANDVVYGLVIMLLFAIPFAAICERLFVSGNTIVKKVGGFAAFFTVTFLFFYCFHPAFALATTPMIIFLAFVIIMMSSFVMVIVYNRFEGEMEQIRMAGMGMHKVDVSRLGTLFATIQLGISNMRRRPLRTFLTGITVVLMTFILLTFASFSPSVGFQRIGLDEAPPYNGVFLRQSAWAEIREPTLTRLERQWGAVATLTPMRWMPPTRMPKYPITGPRGVMAVSGVLGVLPDDPSGVEQSLRRGGADAPRGFGGEQDWIFLSDEVLSRLGVAPGETLSFQGVRLRAGTIDVQKLGSVVQIGGEQITPLAPDTDLTKKADENERLSAAASDGTPDVASTSSVHLSPSACAVVHERVAKRLGASLHGISLVPRERTLPVPGLAEDIARQISATLRVGDGGESWLLTSVGKLSVAGLTAVLIPLILGGLIIFSTMLNSVAERGKEIFIYASLGLAPIHVAALFLVEAGIYAVIGGLGGYMLAQLVVSGLGLAASFGYGVPPDLNYSSFTAVATILLVMFTVLLSAFYPALIASRAANPGTTDFRIPDADGDHLEIAFPFTVSSRDVRGLLAFLTRYFEMRTEASTGCFTAADARMETNDDRLGVAAKVWLAPFDLGISQNLLLEALPTDVRAIFAVRLRLDLLSGQRAAWRRTNIAFLKDLRQQFLVWRTLSPEAMDRYRADGGDEAARARLAAAGDGAAISGAPA